MKDPLTPRPPRQRPSARPVFAPARLRAYRHLRDCDHTTLATAAGITPAAVAAIETGHATPTPAVITALARALGRSPAELHTTADPADNDGYWDAICAAMPPLTGTEITRLGTILRRIHRRTHHQPPDTSPSATERQPRAA